MSASLAFLSATDLLEMIRERKIRFLEFVDLHIQRIEDVDPIRRAAGRGSRGLRGGGWI